MPPPPSSLRFGEYAFDPATGELWRDGLRVRLQPQPSRLLALLLSKPQDVIGRDEIRLALWGRDTHVDFERSLNFCVAKLRSALRDSAEQPRFIETVPTRGYRFIATVTVGEIRVTPPAHDRDSEPIEPPRVPPFVPAASRARPSWVAGLAGVAALAGLIVFQVFFRSPTPVVVVVPFHNETGSPELDRVAKGVSDATVASLATTNRLLVIGNASGLKFSFRPPDMKAIGESLGAEYLVLGQVKRDALQMRVVAHLVRVSDQTHVWANTYDRPTLDLPQQAAIASEIAGAVTLRVGKRR
jgi:TolB-like protein/DNA-binding winged helix-turn-helix (wHTH) protein